MNLLDNINSFLRESHKIPQFIIKQLNITMTIYQNKYIEKKIKGNVLPLSENDNFKCIETDNKCN